MKICLLGWYGTETLGDRAILDGIIYIFTNIEESNNIAIGSLYPVVTERTLFEDNNLYKAHSPNLQINCFDVKNKTCLRKVILSSDIIIMGGGPLMDLDEMHIIEYAFHFAKKNGKKTALLGCGYGPLTKKEYIHCLIKIEQCTDLIIMRSLGSTEQFIKTCGKSNKIYTCCDPALISVIKYKDANLKLTKIKARYWIMNIRDVDYVYSTANTYYKIEKDIVYNFAKQITDLRLMPMHTFYVGGDDRFIENKVAFDLKMKNISVMQKPLSLDDAYNNIFAAEGCVGMRYHAILFQTYLNGNNYIIDYTNPVNGKILSFLRDYDEKNFYKNRYTNILKHNDCNIIITDNIGSFAYNSNMIDDNIRQYCNAITGMM